MVSAVTCPQRPSQMNQKFSRLQNTNEFLFLCFGGGIAIQVTRHEKFKNTSATHVLANDLLGSLS